jgi:uncharacterized damage-inducible protein DinB
MTTIAETLLPEFEAEMATTRKLLERIPEDKAAWKPHEKSSTLGDLATHVANIPIWMDIAIKNDEFDGAANFPRPPKFTTTASLLEFFDRNVQSARAALVGTPDSRMALPWSLKRGTTTMFSRPRAAVLRSFIFSHHIHHRGQLSVYLRMQNVPLPNMYGPTADER